MEEEWMGRDRVMKERIGSEIAAGSFVPYFLY